MNGAAEDSYRTFGEQPPPAGARRSRSKLQKSDSGKNTRVMIYHYYSDKGIL